MDKESFSSSETAQFESQIDSFETEYGVTVSDYCKIEYSIKITDGDDETTQSDDFGCIKVNGKWYLYMGYTEYNTGTYEVPLGLAQQSKTATSVTILVAEAPDGALVNSADFVFTNGQPVPSITNITLYNAAAQEIAWSDGTSWAFASGYSASAEFQAGMTIRITADVISSGDALLITSSDLSFGTTMFTIG